MAVPTATIDVDDSRGARATVPRHAPAYAPTDRTQGRDVEEAAHSHVLAELDGITARLLTGRDDLADALAVLDRAEAQAGAPLVDEAERDRLEAAVADGVSGEHHHAILAHLDGDCVGYAGLVVPDGVQHGTGDVAFQRGTAHCGEVLRALLEGVDAVARDHDAHGTQVWLRQADADDVLSAVAAGYAVQRRLAVLGRPLPADADEAADDDVTVRASTPTDHEGVTEVLAAAYEGTPDGPWDRDRFEEHAAREWFRHEDLLVAQGPGGDLLGVHWTKRRGDATGEVYNLAVAPAGQGRGLGRRLLDAGLDHLAAVGCDDVLLWVDLSNEAAVRLYATAGFRTQWEDIAFLRHAQRVGPHDHGGPGTVH